MSVWLRILGIVVSVLSVAPAFAQGTESLCTIANESIERASSLRTLRIRRPVPCVVQSKEEVRAYILETIDTKIPPGRLEGEEIAFKALGFIPEEYPYKQGILDLYVSQIGGYYDPERARYVMAGWMPAVMQAPVAVHELTHALQDQYYDLKSMMDPRTLSSDQLLARSALVEGDATAIMLDYQRALTNQPPLAAAPDVNAILMANVLGSGLTAGLREVPTSLTLQLLFPYTSGLRFVHSKLRAGGYEGLDAVFRSPPRSTEEVLHPAKYGVKEPDFVEIPSAALHPAEKSFSTFHEDTLGEFSISSLMSMFEGDRARAAEIAAGWGGDRLVVFVSPDRDRYEVVWGINWDSVEDADDFVTRYRESLRGRYGDSADGAVTQSRERVEVRLRWPPGSEGREIADGEAVS